MLRSVCVLPILRVVIGHGSPYVSGADYMVRCSVLGAQCSVLRIIALIASSRVRTQAV
jgi:hypothetical protein